MAEVAVRWIDGGGVRTGGVDRLDEAVASGWAWVDVYQPDERSLGSLGERFGLHPLALEDCLHFPQRPKIERDSSGIFLIWITPTRSEAETVEADELDVFLGTDHLISVHRARLGAIDEVAARANEIMPLGADFTLHAIIDRLVDPFLQVVDGVSDRLETIEDGLLDSPTRDQMEGIYSVRRELVRLHRIVGPERDIIRALARERDLVDEEAYRYLQDVGDHLARLEDSIETSREVAAAAMDIYLSSVSNRMNEIMKVLTVVATIFMPLTLLSGIYGMNVIRGMWPPVEAVWSFWAVCAGMVAIAAWMMWFFKRRKWW